jgi:tetrapyrrole methylase family protein/MazG family protein
LGRSYLVEPTVNTTEGKFRALLTLIARLRSPEGCPWDRSRKQEDIGHYLIEESYEVLEALDSAIPAAIQEELGDLLFQILFLARLAEEEGQFDIAAVLEGITAKMIRRHPHVFGNVRVADEEEVHSNWERIKKVVEHKGENEPRLCIGISRSLSTLSKVQQITSRASAVGFDWPNAYGVLEKMEEELSEFKAALETGDPRRMREEAGDLLFTAVNLCRFAHADAEASLRTALGKFTDRFAYIEQQLAARGRTPGDSNLAEMDALWNEAKKKGSPVEK